MKKILKFILLLALLVFVIPIDGIVFAFANSCAACSNFSQYLGSSVSLFSSVLGSITSILAYFKLKK